ncbi:WD40/YVTN/BNR-like repeat-containing protein [Ramlibacter sp. MMS24-I3-19]|uniref:WD40/YVTN/BNR-like repeat-containing protein n=1 Tax=Ramlibacter sp. MMS24-I3-19 TaxID=3416606 RepID=UPI003CFD60BD
MSWTQQAGLPAGATIWISAGVSDDGQVIVAVALNGGMYRSKDGGASWSRIDTAFNAAENLDYESVAVSADGARIVAAVMGGGIWTSADGRAEAPTFTQAAVAGGGPITGYWRAVDSDATGMRVVAASHNGDVWISDDGGATFVPLSVSVAGSAIADGWYRIALSRDGSTLALAGNEDYGIGVVAGSRSTGLYVGHFAAGGWTFSRASGVVGSYTRLAIAADAPTIAATLSGTGGKCWSPPTTAPRSRACPRRAATARGAASR